MSYSPAYTRGWSSNGRFPQRGSTGSLYNYISRYVKGAAPSGKLVGKPANTPPGLNPEVLMRFSEMAKNPKQKAGLQLMAMALDGGWKPTPEILNDTSQTRATVYSDPGDYERVAKVLPELNRALGKSKIFQALPTVDLSKYDRSVYGDNLLKEYRQASEYSKANGIPYDVSLKASKLARVNRIPGLTVPNGVVGGFNPLINTGPGEDSFHIPTKYKHDPTPGLANILGRYIPYPQLMQHEGGHAVTMGGFTPWAIRKFWDKKLRDDMRAYAAKNGLESLHLTYTELSPTEGIPPMQALQKWIYETTGVRAHTPAEVWKFMAPYVNMPEKQWREVAKKGKWIDAIRGIESLRHLQNNDVPFGKRRFDALKSFYQFTGPGTARIDKPMYPGVVV